MCMCVQSKGGKKSNSHKETMKLRNNYDDPVHHTVLFLFLNNCLCHATIGANLQNYLNSRTIFSGLL